MGSEQSTGAGAGQWPQRSVSAAAADGRVNQFRRGKSLVERSESSTEDHDDSPGNRPGNTSPGPSICSDSDLPYISYTVSRPIGGETCFNYLISTLNAQHLWGINTTLNHLVYLVLRFSKVV